MTEIEKMIVSAQKSAELARVRAVLASDRQAAKERGLLTPGARAAQSAAEGCSILERQFSND